MMLEMINFTILSLLLVLAVLVLMLLSMFFYGAPFEPTDSKTMRKMIYFAKVKKNEKVADLGSGNGKIVIAFAKKGIESHGFEINPFLVWYSRRKIRKMNLENKAFIHWKDFWTQNLKEFNVVCVFQIGNIMGKLGEKLKRELPSGSRVVSNIWKFPNLELKKKDGDVYLYGA